MRKHWVGWMVAPLCLLALTQGCATRSPDEMRLSPYQPDSADRAPWQWRQVLAGQPADSGPLAGRPEISGSEESPAFTRRLRRGGRVSIQLRGIPAPEEVSTVIDDLGGVNLPLIGSMRLAGLTTAEAEQMIAEAYIRSGFYTSITIIVVPDDEEYFVQGEVKREGRYPISRDMTLLQAIAAAGGYTDYANTRKIRVMRGGRDALVVNASRIEKRRERDPLVEPGDIIVVPRRWLW